VATVMISEAAKAPVDALVAEGRFPSAEQAVEASIHALDDEDDLDPGAETDALTDVTDEDREAVREGLHAIKAGQTIPATEVFADLRARFGAS
jgi:Arc/MetJ-type ribon-helix-helix transcriptional regulator